MHAITIVQDVLRKGCPHIHKVRLESLCDVVRAALSATSHTLSNLARALESKTRVSGTATAVRHRVKRVDRLLGSPCIATRADIDLCGHGAVLAS